MRKLQDHIAKRGLLRARRIAVCVLLGALMAGQAGIANAEFRIAHSFAPNSQLDQWVNEFARSAGEGTGQRIRVYPAGQLGRANELYEAMKYGSIDMALLPADVIARDLPQFGVLSLPGIFTNTENIDRIIKKGDLMQALHTGAKKLNFVPLSLGWTFWSIATKDRKILSPEHVQGLSVRTVGSASVIFFASAGAKPVRIPFSETHLALQTGYVDAIMTTNTGWERLAKAGTVNSITWSPSYSLASAGYVLVMNGDVWAKMGFKEQSLFRQIGEAVTRSFQNSQKQNDTKLVDEAQFKNININIMDNDNIHNWQTHAEKVSWPVFTESVPNGNQVLESAISALK